MARTGRPREGGVAKNAPLNMRTSPDLRAKIEQAADMSGRSLTQEVERRLLTSFIFDEVRGGQHIASLANMICSSIQMLELESGHRWMDDFETFTAVRGAVDRLLQWNNPGVNELDRIQQAQDTLSGAKAAREEADEAWGASRTAVTGQLGMSGLGSGMFGAKATQRHHHAEPLVDREAERLLDQARVIAAGEERKAQAEVDSLLAPVIERMNTTEARGRQIADAIFDKLGPRG